MRTFFGNGFALEGGLSQVAGGDSRKPIVRAREQAHQEDRVTLTSDGRIYRVGQERRLEALALGTAVLLSSGRVATLVACTPTRARVRLATGPELDVAPGAELEVLDLVADSGADVADGPQIPARRPLLGAGMRHATPPGPSGRPGGRDASGRPRATCGANFSPRRPWHRHCTGSCRQRAYRRARRSSRTDPPSACHGTDARRLPLETSPAAEDA